MSCNTAQMTIHFRAYKVASMNACVPQGKVATDESRVGVLESDVRHLQADVTEIRIEVRSLPILGTGLALARFVEP
jgi:hypothetical protein